MKYLVNSLLLLVLVAPLVACAGTPTYVQTPTDMRLTPTPTTGATNVILSTPSSTHPIPPASMSTPTTSATAIVWSPVSVPTTELTEGNAKEWSVAASDQKATTIADDFSVTKVGKASLKLQTESGFDVSMRYQLPKGKYWDLSKMQYMHFWLYTQNPSPTGFQNRSPWIQLQTIDGSFIKYQTSTDILNDSRDKWQEYRIPLVGSALWNLAPTGSPMLTQIKAIEIHDDTWDYGFNLWLDGLVFEASGSSISPVPLARTKSPTQSTTTIPPIQNTTKPPDVSIANNLTMPMVIPVLVIKYFPVSAGKIDISVTGDVSMSLDDARKHTDEVTAGIIKTMEDGSRYHNYKNAAVQPSLKYQVVGTLEYLEPVPTWNKPGMAVPMTDYNQIMTRVNAQDWVMNKGVKEIWIWGYQGGKVGLWESNMSSPYGDISNSDRDPNDLPVFGRTYTVYHYNYQRGTSEAIEDHMHQNEAIFNSLNNDLFWNKFVGKVGEGRAGWAHYPPNGVHDYDWANPNYIWTDIEDWKPDDSGQKVYINSSRWNSDSLTWFIYLMQSYPGKNNTLTDGNKKLNNWWIFIGAYDECKAAGLNLTN